MTKKLNFLQNSNFYDFLGINSEKTLFFNFESDLKWL